MARPTDYRQEYAEQARKLCLLGYTDKQLADFFGVNESTITRWKQRHPEFCMSIKMGKTVADANVVESLYKRAIGYDYTEVELKTEGDKRSKRVIKKYNAPDTTAQIFWLKNRQPSNWRDKPAVEEQQEPTPVQIVVKAVDARGGDGDDQSST
jgi:transcriptional regulator with XRE-family HTH domain